jgi:hypothetical protein
MLKLVLPVIVIALVPALAGAMPLNNVATQTVTFQVDPINVLSVSGDPATLEIATATAGQEPDAVEDNSTTYALTTNEDDRKITAYLDSAMPTGMTLELEMAAPDGATSNGFVALGTSAQDIVTGISQVAASDEVITYRCSATVAAGVVASTQRVVTLTLTAGAPS